MEEINIKWLLEHTSVKLKYDRPLFCAVKSCLIPLIVIHSELFEPSRGTQKAVLNKQKTKLPTVARNFFCELFPGYRLCAVSFL